MKCLLLIAFGVVAILAEESPIIKEFATESVQYHAKLYKELVKVNKNNFVVCPLSLQTVFALVNGGAKGNTSKQITTSLRLPEGEDKIKETFLRLGESLQNNDKYTLNSANKMYLDKHFKISDQFKRNAVDIFRSEIENIDLGNAEQAVAEINSWVEEKTHDKIKHLLKKEMLTSDTVAVLINALYFQGKWVKQFADVDKNVFWFNHNDSVVIEMMGISDDFKYYKSSELNATFLEMPYEGDDVNMTFVLPFQVEGLPALEARIADVLVTPKYEVRRVQAVIPKFKIETTTPFIPVLQALGITDAFSIAADFSGIADNQEKLVISEVVQKAFIQVDEKGTTAAAASAVDLDDRSFSAYRFFANHPFIFYLKHRVNGILFIGRYSVPENVH